jgi:O-antigen/teichoic acid export membrane protein
MSSRKEVPPPGLLARGSKRHSLELVPSTIVPGVASFFGLVLIGRWAGGSVLGLTSLAWVVAVSGSSVVALGATHAAVRAVVTGNRELTAQLRGLLLRRCLVVTPLLVGAGLALEALGKDVGGPLAYGGLWMVGQAFMLFEVEVLRAEGRFAWSTVQMSLRAVLGWLASVLAAAAGGKLAAIVLAQTAVTWAVAAAAGSTRIKRPTTRARDELRTLGRPLAWVAAATYLLAFADRFVVAAFLGPVAVGVYTLGYVLGQGLVEPVATPIVGALLPRVVAEWTDNARGPAVAMSTVRKGGLVLVAASAAVIPAIVVAERLGLLDLVSRDPDLPYVAGFVALGSGFYGIARLVYSPMLARRQTAAAATAYWLAVALGAVAVPALTAAWGIVGTAAATLVAYAALAALMVRAARNTRSAQGAGSEPSSPPR